VITFSPRPFSDTDNDWNEVCLLLFYYSFSATVPHNHTSHITYQHLSILQCEGYDIDSPSDAIRDLWRQIFAENDPANPSPFNSFTRDFASGQKPSIDRDPTFSELFYFTYNHIGVFGLNRVAGSQYVDDIANPDVNAAWVADRLANDMPACSLKSIVLAAHITPSSDVNDAFDNYFATCGVLPTLTISGNSHPTTYCFNFNAGIEKRVDLTVEAFRSGPVRISVVNGPNNEHYFHIQDADLENSNSNCPDFASP
jgi:hypothetical protein